MRTQKISAVIGCGRYVDGKEGWAIGHSHAEAYRKADPSLRLIGVDVNRENLEAFGRRFNLAPGDLFESTAAMYATVTPDYVSVCTWPGLHASQVIEAAKAGVKGIVVEKPVALCGSEIDAMISACKESGTKLAVAHQRCHDASFRLAKKLLHKRVIGDNWVLEARVGDGWDILSWSVHWFDLAEWLFDAPAASVLAGVDHNGARRYGHAVENASVVFAEYPQGRQAIFVTGAENPHERLAPVFIRGSEGMMALTGHIEVWNRQDGHRCHKPEDSPGGFEALVAELMAAVEHGAPMACDAARSANATRMAWAAHESARLMRRIEAPFATGYAPLEIVQHPPIPALPAGSIVLMADEHFGSGGREGIIEAVRATTGRDPHVTDATKGITAAELEGAAILLLYHTQVEADAGTKSALTDWVTSGRPVVLLHCAVGAYPDWEEFKQWSGKVWVWGQSEHPYESCELTATHPSFNAWASTWLPLDEVFIKLGDTSRVEVTAEVRISSGTWPAAWTSEQWPNVTAWIPGHRREMWSIPAMREALVRQMQLAVKGAAGR
jgi:predicted dehydrogenase